MKKIVFVLLAACFLFSCSSTQDKLPRVWFYISSESATKESAKRNVAADLSSLSFLNLQSDGTYTAYLTSFEHGRWLVKNGEELVLENNNKKELILPIQKIKGEELVFTLHGRVYQFEGFENDFASADENPFSKENNEWRIKANHKESDKEITGRLHNHFRFWETYFAWALKTEKEILNVRSLPSPLKLYSNGFAVIPFEEQSPKWTDNFYDSTDGRRAFAIVDNLFKTEDIDWPNTKNRFKLFVSAFQQLQEKISRAPNP